MKRIEFIKDLDGRKHINTFDKNDILLYYFVDELNVYELNEYLPQIESIANGEKTFEEIEEGALWTFGEEAGYFECDTEKAYFVADEEGCHPDAPSIEMPIQELIQILKDWQKFLNKK